MGSLTVYLTLAVYVLGAAAMVAGALLGLQATAMRSNIAASTAGSGGTDAADRIDTPGDSAS